ncbi:MAG: aminopeptidase N [Rhodothermales bacterium]
MTGPASSLVSGLRLIAAVLLLFSSGSVAGQAGPGGTPGLRVAPTGNHVVAWPGSDHAHRLSMRGGSSVASADFDATYYGLQLRIELNPNNLVGTVRVKGVARVAMTQLVLDFDDAMHVEGVLAPSGSALASTHSDNALTIALPGAVSPGEEVDVTINYQGLPPSTGLGGFVFDTLASGKPAIWSLSEPYAARTWWPSRDHPSDKADSVDVSIEVPQPLMAASNGLLTQTETLTGGYRRFSWSHRYPIATYLVSVAVAEYDFDQQIYTRPAALARDLGSLDLPLVHYSFAGNGAFLGNHPQFGFQYITDIFPVLERWFGPYPFDREKYGHAQFTFGGAMEHQTLSSMTTNYQGTMAHELAHQWFGDSISPDSWPHLWLNEGFATFGELAYWNEAEFPGVYDQIFDIYYNRALTAEGTVVVQDTTDVLDMFAHSRVYAKGWMVLRMLRGMLGEVTFREVMRAYAADPRYQYGTATTDEFQSLAEAVSGQDLGYFFDQWVSVGDGYPTYTATWGKRPNGADWDVEVTVGQTTSGSTSLFRMPLRIRVETSGADQDFVVFNQQPREAYFLTVADEPTGIAIDPNRWILRARDVRVTSTEGGPDLPEAPALALYPNPTTSWLSIDSTFPDRRRAELVDGLGRVVSVHGLIPGFNRLSVSSLPAGFYGLRMGDGRTHTFLHTPE